MVALPSIDSTHLATATMPIIRTVPTVGYPDGEPLQYLATVEVNAVKLAEGETRYGIPHFSTTGNAILTANEREYLLALAGIFPPLLVDVPYLAQEENILTCTKGNWQENPKVQTFAYQWKRDGVLLSPSIGDTYKLDILDIGRVFTCIVTATHQFGSTPSESNEVIAE